MTSKLTRGLVEVRGLSFGPHNVYIDDGIEYLHDGRYHQHGRRTYVNVKRDDRRVQIEVVWNEARGIWEEKYTDDEC